MKKGIRVWLCLVMSLVFAFQSVIPVAAFESDADILDYSSDTISDIDTSDGDLITDSSDDYKELTELSHDDSDATDTEEVLSTGSSNSPSGEITVETDGVMQLASGLPDEDALFAKYVDSKLGVDYYEDTEGPERVKGGSAYKNLSAVEQKVYSRALKLIEAVANGEEDSTDKLVTADDIGLTKEESRFYVEDFFNLEWDGDYWGYARNFYNDAKAKGLLENCISQTNIINALCADHPELLYWFGREYYIAFRTYSYEKIDEDDIDETKIKRDPNNPTIGTYDGWITVKTCQIKLSVSKTYAGSDDHKVNVSKTSATKTAITNAKSIANQYASLADYAKLDAFRQKICSMVSYNESAANSNLKTLGSDPWELIYVFDNDSNTNVVCEGYSKAFQYLCDLSTFVNDVDVISVTGTINGGGHEWNIVKFNGKNYLVDVTNCDNIPEYASGHNGLFMKGYKSGSVSSGYVVNRPQFVVNGKTYLADDIKYAYDKNTLDLYAGHYDVLTLNNTDFDPNEGPVISLKITKEPQDVTTNVSGLVMCEVVAEGEGLTYKWECQYPNKDTWEDFGSTSSKLVKLQMKAEWDGLKVRCLVSDKNGLSTYSRTATLRLAKEFKITEQPKDASANTGEKATMSIKATGEGLTYQWQYYNGKSWVNSGCSGNKTDTLTIVGATSTHNTSYRCVVTDKNGKSLNSNSAKFTLKDMLSITEQPKDASANTGEKATMSVKATGEGLTYQWQYYNGKSWVNSGCSGNKTDTLTIVGATSTHNTSYRCVVTDKNGKSLNSSSAKFTLKDILSITEQPKDASANTGEKATMSVKATGEGLTYQWQYYNGKSWVSSGCSGNKTDTITIVGATSTHNTSYRCVVTDKTGKSLNSSSAKFTLKDMLSITEQPKDASANTGEKATMSVKATGAGLTYQWQYYNGKSWVSSGCSGNKTDTITIVGATSTHNTSYRCVVTDKTGKSLNSSSAKFTLKDILSITEQPKDASANTGEKATMSVKATGAGLTYQWQYYNGKSWVNSGCSGNKTDTITITGTESTNNTSYRCVVKDKTGRSITSNAAKFTVKDILGIIEQPKDASANLGEKATMSVKANGADLTYQWQYYSGKEWINSGCSGNKTDTITITGTESTNNTSYRCVVKDKTGKSITSNAAKFTVKDILGIIEQPKDASANLGEKATMSVKANGAGLTYQWQYYSGKEWINSGCSGNKTDTITITGAENTNNTSYRCVVKDKTGKSITSNAAKFTVKDLLKITEQPQNTSANLGEYGKMTVKANGTGLTYQWQVYNGKSWVNSGCSGNKTDTLSIYGTEGTNNATYRCVVTDKNGKSLTSNTAKFTVKYIFLIKQQPVDVSCRANETAVMSVSAVGEGLTYKWQYYNKSWTTPPTSCQGTTTNTLKITGSSTLAGKMFRCVITNNAGKTVTSSEAKFSFVSGPQITQQPTDGEGYYGEYVQFTVAAEGTGLKYQWYSCYMYGNAMRWYEAYEDGAKTSALNVQINNASTGNWYKCVVSDKNGNKIETNTVRVYDKLGIKITKQPVDKMGSNGSIVTLSVEATGDELKYSWLYCVPDSDPNRWMLVNTPHSFSSDMAVTIDDTTVKNLYRCQITDYFGNTVKTNIVRVINTSYAHITKQPVSVIGNTGTSTSFTVEAQGDGLTYQWYSCPLYSAPERWTVLTGNGANTKTLSLTIDSKSVANAYKCIVRDSHGNAAESNHVKLTIKPDTITGGAIGMQL